MKQYCRYKGIMCEFATEYGYCQITACVKRGRRAGMSVIIKGDSALDISIVSKIKDVESQYIKFQNIYFKCKSIEDAGGTIFVKRKKGKWLPDNNNYYEERFICSVCGKSYKVDTCMGKPMWDFCPCGAKMKGGNENE